MDGKTLRELQRDVDAYIRQYREGYFKPLSMLARMAEEVGELAREVNHRYGEKPKKPDEAEGEIAMELGDILFIVICFANSMGIDLEEAFHRVMHKYNTRDANRWTRVDSKD
ncbi:MAG: nucleotide pyrophosphohydrolase [Planifilum sp.]